MTRPSIKSLREQHYVVTRIGQQLNRLLNAVKSEDYDTAENVGKEIWRLTEQHQNLHTVSLLSADVWGCIPPYVFFSPKSDREQCIREVITKVSFTQKTLHYVIEGWS